MVYVKNLLKSQYYTTVKYLSASTCGWSDPEGEKYLLGLFKKYVRSLGEGGGQA